MLSIVTQVLIMRTDMLPFIDIQGRRAISHAIDCQGLIRVVWGRGEWALPIDQLGTGTKY